jgi:hypothetical protein
VGDSIRDAGERLLAAQRAAEAVAGQTLALSVVIDGRFEGGPSRHVAKLVARLGLAGVWLRQPWPAGIVTSAASPGTILASLAAEMAPFPVGMVADADDVDAGILQALIQTSARGEAPGGAGLAAASLASGLRLALTGTAAGLARWQRWIGVRPSLSAAEIGVAVAETGGPVQPGRAVPAFGGAVFVPFAAGRDLATAVANAAVVAAGRPVWVEIAVSVGRTAAEARARADTEELFALVGNPGRDGLFGTLEECQEAAARLAHAGATELICYLPRSTDLPDVLAQLRAIAVGAGVLRPGGPRSSPPPPPVGWGGRRPTA